MRRRHKYNAKAVTLDGYRFDSQAEARRYQELKLLMRAKEITNLKVHPRFVLQEKFTHNGETVRAISYEADFSYTDTATGVYIVEDVKGYETPVFKLKRKLFLKRYPDLKLSIVKY